MKKEEEEWELKPLKDIKAGDVILGPDNEEVTVLQDYEEHFPDEMYEIELDNGVKIKASGNHLWYIETEFNKQNYKNRVKKARKYFKRLTKEMIKELEDISNSEDDIETSLIDMLALIDAVNDTEAFEIMFRIAKSLGKVSENNTLLKDSITGETVPFNNVSHYDAKQFSQQILSLMDKKYEDKWKIVLGEVVTTNELMDFYDVVSIPTLKDIDNR